MDQIDMAQQLQLAQAAVNELIDASVAELEERIFHIMDTKPDTLTGKTAMSLTGGRKALIALREDVADKVRLLTPSGAGHNR